MANVYTNEAALLLVVGSDRLTKLQDRSGDGTPDANALDAAIEWAGRYINRRLAQRYAVPFAEITDDPDTPDEIQEIANDLVLYRLYRWFEPKGDDALSHKEDADDALERLREGKDDVVGAARQSAASAGQIAVYSSEDNLFAGRDSNDVENTRGI